MKRILILGILFITAAGYCFSQGPDNSDTHVSDFVQEGIASWYGAEFEGKTTASGEIFRSDKLSAAHPVLPFGTIVKVTNLHNQKSVTVSINDRGPFVASRIIDVSRAAAEELDMIITGTAPVRIEVQETQESSPKMTSVTETVLDDQKTNAPHVLPTASVPEPDTVVPVPVQLIPAMPDPDNGKVYRLQVGSYRQTRNALDAFKRLEAQGLNPAYERYNTHYRVVLAGIASGQIEDIVKKLALAGFSEVLIKEEH